MAQIITITIENDAKAVLLLNAFCTRFGYKDTVYNPVYDSQLPEDSETNPQMIPNPESKKKFLKRFTIRWWREAAIAGVQKTTMKAAEDAFSEDTIAID